ncbi:unnamed protein product [Rotaria socialis]
MDLESSPSNTDEQSTNNNTSNSINEESSSSNLSPSNIIGTHPNEIITSINPDNGYPVRQENGQRKTGPPPDWPTTRQPPGRGCEVFVGKLPRDCFESELFPLFERCGQIYEMRLMMDFSGCNRGYAFVTYTNRDDAKRCVKELNNYEMRSNHLIGVCQSVDNCRLFVGGIPKTKKREEILEEMCKVTEGVVDVIVYPSANDKTKNRGFAFVEYESHRSAAMARRKLLPGNIQLWGQQIAVDWAEPENQVDEDIMANVRVLYVRNLMMGTTEEQIKEVFERFKPNSIERVKKLKDYAFVHFKQRDDALHAMNLMNGCELDGSIVEVTLAKPVDKNQYFRFTRGVSPSALTANLPFAFQAAIPTTNTTTMQMTNGTTVIPVAVNPLQQNKAMLNLDFLKSENSNVRRCVNATGRLSTNGNTSPPLLSRTTPTGVLSSSSRPSQPSPNIAHHRGAYYTILRPTSRRTDISFTPTAFGFPPGTPLFQPTAIYPHPLLTGHPNSAQPFPQQSFVFATTGNNGQTQQFFHAHPQANFSFPFIFTPPLVTPQTPTSTNPETSIYSYATPTSSITNADSSTFSA